VVLLAVAILLVGVAVGLLVQRDWGSDSGSSTVVGSGIAATQPRDLGAFTAVELAGSNIVTVHVGDEQSVVVHADQNLIGFVTTEVRAGDLVIGTMGSFAAKSPMSVDVTVPRLDAATLSGSGVVTIDGVRAGQLVVRVPGSGVLSVSGTAGRLDASLAGSADVRLQDLVARDVKATVSGSGRLQVHATGSLDASVSGVGVIFYGGNPRELTKSVSGTGAIVGQ
jgi:hypothetical protein